MALEIRIATAADVPAMHAVRLSVRENQLSNPLSVTHSCYLPFVGAGSAWVAEENGRIQGFAACDLESGSVWALFVSPAAERRGVGRRLHDRLVAHAQANGLQELTLRTGRGTRAERFYADAGWSHSGKMGDEICLVKRLTG